MMKIDLADIRKAKRKLDHYLKPTPLVLNTWLSEMLDCEVYLKLENMQPIGSFKIRGATYKISELSKQERRRGVIAASAGNHAQGVAWGSRQLGVSSMIVMPNGASIVKLENTKALGAEVILKGNTYDQACQAARVLAQETQRVFVHAFEDPLVIAGQGTLGLELFEQLPDVDFVVGAVGGGGMMTGVSSAFRSLRPTAKMIACQAAGAPSMFESIRKHKAISLPVQTFADGIAVGSTSDEMRRLLSPLIDRWIKVDEDAIATAVLMLLEKAKIIAEGSGAVPLAALGQMRTQIKGKKVALIISGGNIDVNLISRIIDLGLIRTGRRLRVNVLILDRPGSLAILTDLVGKSGSNILQVIHDRSKPSARINQTDVELTLETRGPEHSRDVVKILRKHVLKLEVVH